MNWSNDTITDTVVTVDTVTVITADIIVIARKKMKKRTNVVNKEITIMGLKVVFVDIIDSEFLPMEEFEQSSIISIIQLYLELRPRSHIRAPFSSETKWSHSIGLF